MTTDRRYTYIISKWAVIVIALTLSVTTLLQTANLKPAFAISDSYSWPNAPCATSGSNLGKTSGTGYWCTGYNWAVSTCPTGDNYCSSGNKMNGYYLYDQWGEGFRNCVSYTSSMLSQQFNINPSNWGNGTDWNNSALAAHYTDDSSPQIGDVAQWDGTQQNRWGHVAYVYNVVSGVAYYAEYNYAQDGTFQNTYTSSTQGAPTHYIHIGTVAPSGLSLSSPLVVNGRGGYYANAPIDEAYWVQNNTSQSIAVKRLLVSVTDPYHTQYNEDCVTPSTLTLSSGQSYKCYVSVPWGSTGTYTTYADWEDTSNVWHYPQLGTSQSFSLTPPWSLEATLPLTLANPSGYYANIPISETVRVTNTTGSSITPTRLVVAVTDPSNTQYDEDCFTPGSVTIGAGQSYTCTLSQPWSSTGAYSAYVDWQNGSGWHTGQLGGAQPFTLSATPNLGATSPLSISAPSGYHVNTNINETFTVKNETGSSITPQRLVVVVYDPSLTQYAEDCVTPGSLTLSAGQSYTCNLSQAWGSTGTYSAYADWKDTSGVWHYPELGPNQTFTLAP